MINRDDVTLKEKENDGQTVFLYYDDLAGVYLAYGLSAYYTTLVTNPIISFSMKMNMPVALLMRENVLGLRQSMIKVEHRQKEFYHFKMKTLIGDAGYEKWEKKIREKHEG